MKNETGARSTEADAALLDLLHKLRERNYAFTTPTPATHGRVIQRPGRRTAKTIEDVLGWSLPFGPGIMPAKLVACLQNAEMVEEVGSQMRSRIRVSSLRGALYLHSAYPTVATDAVFFGPDSYRFADLVASELMSEPVSEGAHIVDIGTGAGVGAIVAAATCASTRISMTDINTKALRFARINAAAADIPIQAVECAGLEKVDGRVDVALINPPYIMDEHARTYRDGGGMHGAELSLDLAMTALERLNPGGRVILYTGSAIVSGQDALRSALEQRADADGWTLSYKELDPDVFGEELDHPAYQDVERIALIAAIIRR
jgi:methylase of polypeptide subunit release factors